MPPFMRTPLPVVRFAGLNTPSAGSSVLDLLALALIYFDMHACSI